MKANTAIVIAFFALAAWAQAASISGTISGVSGPSVVYVDGVPGKTFPPPATHAAMDQRGMAFQPHILVVQRGATVDFLNSDSVAHNVFWPGVSGNRKLGHNLGTWPSGQTRSFKFDNAGIIPLFCNTHSEMSAYIVVVPTPYYAQTDSSGNYRIENLPDGKYTVTVWHEGARSQSKPVSVPAKLDFALSK